MTVRALMVAGRVGITLKGGTGGTVSRVDGVAPYDTIVGVRFNTDGTVETGKSINGAAITWSAAGEWIEPNGEADNTYSVRYTNKVGTPDFTIKAAIEDTWIALVDGLRTWTMQSTIEENRTFDCDFEVRKTAGAPPNTGSSAYTFTIANTS